MSIERVTVTPLEPDACDWEDCALPARYCVENGDQSWTVCGRHKRASVASLEFDAWLAERQRVLATEEEEARRAAHLGAQEREQQALHERIKTAHEAGEVYPLLLPPGLPETLRADVQKHLVERG